MGNIYIYPIHIGPTKPLVPNHIRHLLYTDLLYKTSKVLNKNTYYIYNRLDMDVGNGLIEFSNYINDTYPSSDEFYLDKDSCWVGKQYVEYNRNRTHSNNSQIYSTKKRVIHNLNGHNFYKALIKTWLEQHRKLNIFDPGLTKAKKWKMKPNQILELLLKKGMLLDMRNIHGGIYLDHTDKGVHLKLIQKYNNLSYNYLLLILLNTLSNCKKGDTIIYLYDDEMTTDYNLVIRTVEEFGIKTESYITSRILLDGSELSSRKGGWEPYALNKVISRYENLGYTNKSISLGFRLYYLGFFKGRARLNFDYKIMDKFMNKASYLLQMCKNESKSSGKIHLAAVLNKISYNKTKHISISPITLTEYIFGNKLTILEKASILSNLYLS